MTPTLSFSLGRRQNGCQNAAVAQNLRQGQSTSYSNKQKGWKETASELSAVRMFLPFLYTRNMEPFSIKDR